MKLITSGEFATVIRAGIKAPADTAVCRAAITGAEPGSNGRVIKYILSDQSVGRDGDIIFSDAWQLENYRTNPVFLWAHDSSQLPIGRMAEIGTVGDRLMGTAEFPDEGEYPFADTVFNLYRSGYLNATSAGWLPLEWRFSKDKNRVGGIDFLKVDALEFSAVPVPALPTALVTARSAGIDTGPLYEWAEKVIDNRGQVLIPRAELETLRRAAKMPTPKTRAASEDWTVGAARDLPVDNSDAWDGPAAAERMLDDAGFNGDAPDSSKARRGFLVFDSANDTQKGSYKLPFADLVGGDLKAVVGGIRAAASRLPQTDIPSDVQDRARAVLDEYEHKAGMGSSDANSASSGDSSASRKFDAVARAALIKEIRGLYQVSWLAMLLEDLSDVCDMSEWEASYEGDNSPIPDRLAAVLQTLGQILVDMTAEEVAELVAGDDVEVEPADAIGDDMMMAAAKTPAQRAVAGLARLMRRRAPAVLTMEQALAVINGQRAARGVAPATADELLQPPVPPVLNIGSEQARLFADALNRSGRTLSAENERSLRAAADMHDQATAMVRSVCDTASGAAAATEQDPADNPGSDAGGGDNSNPAPAVITLPMSDDEKQRARKAAARARQLAPMMVVEGNA